MKWFLLLIPLLLASCATPTCDVTVTTFHKLPPKGNGQIFDIKLINVKDTLENQTYLSQIVTRLEKHGWKYEPKAKKPDVVLYMVWNITKPMVSHGVRPVYAQTGGGGTTYHRGTVNINGNLERFSGTSYTEPTYSVVGYAPTETVSYDRYLMILAHDGNGEKILDSSASSVGDSGKLSLILPLVIDAYFDHFPGKSGSTRIYTKAIR